jgi:hypothetical protein
VHEPECYVVFAESKTTVILFLWYALHASKASLLCEKLAFDIAVSILLVESNPHIKICYYTNGNFVFSAEIELKASQCCSSLFLKWFWTKYETVEDGIAHFSGWLTITVTGIQFPAGSGILVSTSAYRPAFTAS